MDSFKIIYNFGLIPEVDRKAIKRIDDAKKCLKFNIIHNNFPQAHPFGARGVMR